MLKGTKFQYFHQKKGDYDAHLKAHGVLLKTNEPEK